MEISGSVDARLRLAESDGSGALDNYWDIGFIANSFRINEGGTTRLHIDTDGKVGIGTASPSQLLDVAGQINSNNTITGASLVSTGGMTAATIISVPHSSQGFSTGVSGHVVNLSNNGTQSILYSGNDPLILRSSNLQLQSPGGELYLKGILNGATSLYFDDNERLFTSTDGVTVRGSTANNGKLSTGSIVFTDADNSTRNTTNNEIRRNSANDLSFDSLRGFYFNMDSNNSDTNGQFEIRKDGADEPIFTVNETGDIQFYHYDDANDSSGTTVGMTWNDMGFKCYCVRYWYCFSFNYIRCYRHSYFNRINCCRFICITRYYI